MGVEEYNKVKDFTYDRYCEYLQEKYGKAKADYFTPNWNKRQLGRTNEGLILHHIREDEAVMLSNPNFAKMAPYEYQSVDNLTYCNYLEHLLLHVMIIEKSINELSILPYGLGGMIYAIVPELNDWYSGYYRKNTQKTWGRDCYEVIKDNEETYLEILKRYIIFIDTNRLILPINRLKHYEPDILFSSANDKYGKWSEKKNNYIYEKIKQLIDENYNIL